MPHSAIDVVRYINAYDISICRDNDFINSIIKKHIKQHFKDSSRYIIPYERRIQIMKKYEEGNKYVAKKYLNRNDGELFYEPLPDINECIQDITMPTGEEIINNIFAPIIFDIKNELKKVINN